MSTDPPRNSFFRELKRRNVVKVAIAYAVTAWVLVQVASVVLPTFGSPEWVLQVFTALVILGFPLALLFAWAFEITPEGLKRTHEVPLEQSITAQTGRKLDFIIIGVLVVLLTVSLFVDFFEAQLPDGDGVLQAHYSRGSIAVLPFKNLSPGSERTEKEYMADGMTDSIITALSKFPDLRVTARNSSFAYKGKSIRVQDIGSQLGVRYVLEGSVMTAGDTVRSTIQLVETSSGKGLWAANFDRDFVSRDDVLNVLDDVTQAIVTAIMSPDSGPYAHAERSRALARNKKSLSAYEFFLRGKQKFYQYNAKDNAEARRLFEKSIEIDPSFAKTHANLAWTHAMDFDFEWSDDPDYSLSKAFEAGQKAYELDDADYESLWALGWSYFHYQGKHEIALKFYERAVELNSNDAEMLAEMGNILIYTGQPERAIVQLLQAIERNPFRDQWYDEYLGWAYDEAGQYDRAIQTLSGIHSHEGWWGHAYLACSYADLGRMQDANAEVQRIFELEPDFSWDFYLDWVNNKRRYLVTDQRDRRITCLARAMGQPADSSLH
ncbi:MAG: tetratricopeptide repeat protein [Woeseia sp.]